MMQIAVSTEDLAKIRFAISPMLTTVLSVGSLLHPDKVAPMRDWFDTMCSQVSAEDMPALQLLYPDGHYTFDFLLPFPETTYPKFDDELEKVATLPLSTIEADIEYLIRKGTITQSDLVHYRNLASLRARAVDELAFFWHSVMQPHWDAIKSVLEGDLMHHSRKLVAGGASNMFQGLDSFVKMEASDLLTICTKAHLPVPIDPQGQGLVLMPNLVSHCGVWVQVVEGKPPIISYRAFGAGLWNRRASATQSDAMNILFGENRARLLYELAIPASTKDLALKLDLTPGAISQQLGQLKQAGLVDANRSGRSVYYYLNGRGEQLLNLLNQ